MKAGFRLFRRKTICHTSAFRRLSIRGTAVRHFRKSCVYRRQSVYLFKNYEFDLDESTAELLEIDNIQDVEVMTILTMAEPFEKSTANLLAPIIVNRKNMMAKQVVLHDSSYTTKHPIGGESC